MNTENTESTEDTLYERMAKASMQLLQSEIERNNIMSKASKGIASTDEIAFANYLRFGPISSNMAKVLDEAGLLYKSKSEELE